MASTLQDNFLPLHLGAPRPDIAQAFGSGRAIDPGPAYKVSPEQLATPFRVQNPWQKSPIIDRPLQKAYQQAPSSESPFGVQTPTFMGTWRQAANAAFGNGWQPGQLNPWGDQSFRTRSPNPADSPNRVWSRGFWADERKRATAALVNQGTVAGGITNLGGAWADIDKWNAEIIAAINRVKTELGVDVPANVVKAIMMIESGGVWLDANYAGYYGLMQVGPGSWGAGSDWDPEQARTDPAYNIYAGTWELGRRWIDAQSQNPAYTWSNVAVGYFSGGYVPDGDGDRWNSDYNYQKMFNEHLAKLNAGQPVDMRGNPTGPTTGVSGNQLVTAAQAYLGYAYILGTAGEIGPDGRPTFDCSGFVWYLYGQITGTQPDPMYRDSHQQFTWGTSVARADLQPGDLVFHDTQGGREIRNGNAASHVSIYMGNGKLINAANPSQGVIMSDLAAYDAAYTFLGARRLPGAGNYQPGVSGNPTAVGMKGIWGGGDMPITQPYGPGEFSNGNQIYAYGANYTLDGRPMGHTGIDVGMAVGTPLFSGISGTVQIAGGSGFYESDLTGPDQAWSPNAPGRGQLSIVSHDGQHMLTLGHMDSITVAPGTPVTAGMRVGTSGSSNGPHVHVEYMVKDARTSSGWLLVDPAVYLNGMVAPGAQPDQYAGTASPYWKLPGWEGYDRWQGGSIMPYRPWWLVSGYRPNATTELPAAAGRWGGTFRNEAAQAASGVQDHFHAHH